MTTLPANIDHPCYHDDSAARAMLEAIYWPYGPTCPKCRQTETVTEYGKSMGPGWYWCSACREKFTVRVGNSGPARRKKQSRCWKRRSDLARAIPTSFFGTRRAIRHEEARREMLTGLEAAGFR